MGGLSAARFLVTQLSRFGLDIIQTDPYVENLAELFSATKRTGVQNIIETNLRSEHGTVIKRPLGTARKFIDFDGLMFISSHFKNQALTHTIPVNTDVVIGPLAKKPLRVTTPLLISGMAYKRALSAKFKAAFALGSTKAGTATNTGEGAYLQQERELAQKLIVQYPRIPLHRNLTMLRDANAIEIQIAQGASAGGAQAPYPHLIRTSLPALRNTRDLPKLVSFLKKAGDGIPVGIKFSLSDHLEEEIDFCLKSGVDYLALEGAQAATVAAAPILEDDFGLPTLIGLCRAVKHLRLRKAENKVSLIISGGFNSPGQCLKALALGANAIYMGTMPLFAASHTQSLKAVPWEPPTQLAMEGGKMSKRFNWRKGAHDLGNYLNSCTEEIKEGVRALGKQALLEVNERDLVSLDEITSKITGIPLGYYKRKT